MHCFTDNERRRYSRQIAVDGIGDGGQRRIIDAKVFITGCGALGSMVAMQLAGAGVGHIGISDSDSIDVSNLQRQYFFTTSEAGRSKASVLAGKIRELNPGCEVECHDSFVTEEIAPSLFSGYDFVVDATDNAASKCMIENVCGTLGKPCCIGGVSGFRGQVMTVFPGEKKFGDIFPTQDDDTAQPGTIAGVAGPAASVCASLQAAEVIKYLCGTGTPLVSRVLVFDLLSNSFEVFRL